MEVPARKAYPSDLSDAQWAIIEPWIPEGKTGGRPRTISMRDVINSILYLLRSGCQWDMIPHDLLPKSSVYDYYAAWKRDGTWQRIMDELRSQVRVAEGREPTPSAASVDSQTVKIAEQGGVRGYDGAKKITGRKRHLVVDTVGMVLAVLVTSAAVDDAAAAPKILSELCTSKFPRLLVVWGDNKYHNHDLNAWKELQQLNWRLEIVSRPEGVKGFALMPRRWVVERTHAWNGRCRRLSKDYEQRLDSSETMIRLASIHLMLRRLAPAPVNEFHYRTAA